MNPGVDTTAVAAPVVTYCQDVVSASDATAESAWNVFSVFMRRELLQPQQIPQYSVALVEAPKHGAIYFTNSARTRLLVHPTPFLASTLTYRSDVGYLGADSATFRVISKGASYVVSVNFLVQPYVSESSDGHMECKAAGMEP